ncbi:MAG: ABC transporter ATP-binding protein [Chloroflexota bacterium]|nr:ABC transporter ATP-binding protein [Chloroflexota bacterium]
MPDTLVAARNLERTYTHGNTTEVALASATCMVRDGDRIAVVGPSGSGKSTLLHLLGGLDQPTRGEIAWPALGARETLRPRHIAFVFQTPSLLPSLTAVENVALPLLLGHMPPDDARRAAMDALARLELAGIADKLPEELSGGQMQRVGVARALAYHPRLILADEPTGQLDGATAHHLLETLLGALASTDTALVIATHDPNIAARMETIWHIEHGRLDGITDARTAVA